MRSMRSPARARWASPRVRRARSTQAAISPTASDPCGGLQRGRRRGPRARSRRRAPHRPRPSRRVSPSVPRASTARPSLWSRTVPRKIATAPPPGRGRTTKPRRSTAIPPAGCRARRAPGYPRSQVGGRRGGRSTCALPPRDGSRRSEPHLIDPLDHVESSASRPWPRAAPHLDACAVDRWPSALTRGARIHHAQARRTQRPTSSTPGGRGSARRLLRSEDARHRRHEDVALGVRHALDDIDDFVRGHDPRGRDGPARRHGHGSSTRRRRADLVDAPSARVTLPGAGNSVAPDRGASGRLGVRLVHSRLQAWHALAALSGRRLLSSGHGRRGARPAPVVARFQAEASGAVRRADGARRALARLARQDDRPRAPSASRSPDRCDLACVYCRHVARRRLRRESASAAGGVEG